MRVNLFYSKEFRGLSGDRKMGSPHSFGNLDKSIPDFDWSKMKPVNALRACPGDYWFQEIRYCKTFITANDQYITLGKSN